MLYPTELQTLGQPSDGRFVASLEINDYSRQRNWLAATFVTRLRTGKQPLELGHVGQVYVIVVVDVRFEAAGLACGVS
ncbi:MAG TPA: hypothetical protein PKN33_19065 [Phycisphaerae bacterium]|nr:hypothetical protein [Phycisphaerae bacterium]